MKMYREKKMARWLVILLLVVVMPRLASAQQLKGTLKKIKDTKTIALGHRDSSPPFSSVGSDKKPAGYSIDLCHRIADSLKQQVGVPDLQIKWVLVHPDTRMQAVASGAVDLECGSTTISLSRLEQVDFSVMTFITGGSLLLRVAAGIQGVSDLGGKRVGVIPGTTTEKALTPWLKQHSVSPHIVQVKEHADGLAGLEGGTLDAYASDQVLLIGLGRSAKDPTKLTLLGDLFSYEPYGLMLRRGDPDFRLAVNRVLAGLYRSGEIGDVFKRWFAVMGARPSPLLLALYALHSLPE
jgi:ABC-type amino acid transport substrate-binding protein